MRLYIDPYRNMWWVGMQVMVGSINVDKDRKIYIYKFPTRTE